MLSPSHDLGIVILANTDMSYDALIAIPTEILRSSLPERPSPQTCAPAPPPQLRSPTVGGNSSAPTALYTGTYSNPGYGAFTICDSTTTSEYCQRVRLDFGIVDEQATSSLRGSANTTSSESLLLAAWPRFWADHLRFSHIQGNQFRVDAVSLFPKGYGKDKSPFQYSYPPEQTSIVDFVVNNGKVVGFGLSGTVDVETNRQKAGGTIEQMADVWFDRV